MSIMATHKNFSGKSISNPIDWLCANAPGFDSLTQEERNAIMHFALLWSFFEAKVLGAQACAKSIVEVSKRWESEARLKPESFSNYLSYFQRRYFKNGKFTDRFDSLRFRKNDNKELVEAVVKGETKNIGEIAAALLIIVYRLRNNLFHGEKWAYGINGQLDNFTNANSLLMLALELHRSSVSNA